MYITKALGVSVARSWMHRGTFDSGSFAKINRIPVINKRIGSHKSPRYMNAS